MILITNCALKEIKNYSNLKIGNILKRKSDNFFYELKNISYNELEKDYLYIFYGFAIKFSKNLKNHFETENGLFLIY